MGRDPADELAREATAAIGRGDWAAARGFAARLLDLAPGPQSLFLAGVVASRLNDPQAAIGHLRRASLLDPDLPGILIELARALLAVGRIQEAVAAADRATSLRPEDGRSCDMLGVIYGQAGLHEQARKAFERAVELTNGEDAGSRFNLGTTLAFAGEIPRAEAEFEACLATNPAHWRAYLFRSQVRRQSSDHNHVDALREVVSRTSDRQAQIYVNLALAKELEDLGRYEESFAHLVAGKSAGGRDRDYSIERDEALFRAVADCFPAPMSPEEGFGSEEPVFVIGMPRSGTTLVERILSSHQDVHSAGELRNFVVALAHANGGAPDFMFDPEFPRRVATMDWRALGERYVSSTRPGTGHTPHFVDKFPQNFLYAGFIARALPRARIVCLRRGAADTCLSNFRQLFALDSPYFDYSFDLLDTGRYYLLFDRLIAHWQRVLPGRILELSYERLVEHQEAETRRLLEFCGLSWNDACLRFEQNLAPVATASTVQVREPMNRRSIGRWRRYEQEMTGLVDLLARHGVAPDASD